LSFAFTLEIALRAAVTPPLPPVEGPIDLCLCFVDHFEPHNGRVSDEVARARMEEWRTRYPEIALRHRDADGRPPAHGFFYPWDEQDPGEIEQLAELCAAGCGEVDLHLHHRDDTDATLREKLRAAVRAYDAAGLLSHWEDGRPAFGFIHGDWSLDNSRSDGGRSWCGVNNELDVLREEGCYADFTFPAWQHTAQPRQVNSIYHAVDDPEAPKSYDFGLSARVDGEQHGLLIVQGPLVPYWDRRLFRLAMDDGDVAKYRRYAPVRLDRWVRAGIHVQGRPDRIFIKLHTHGAAEGNRQALLGADFEALFSDAEARYNDGRRYRLHYLTARETYNVVAATTL
jgi:hypothetical protein